MMVERGGIVMTARMVDRRRSPELAGRRLTVYDILDYV